MTMTAKEAIRQAREGLHLDWTSHEDPERATSLVDSLVKELSSPEAILQTVQVLWLSLDPPSRERPSAKRVLEHMAATAPMLTNGETALSWAQLAAWAALRVRAENEPRVAAAVRLLRSPAEWCRLDERRRNLYENLIKATGRITKVRLARDTAPYVAFEQWPTEEQLAEPASWENLTKFVEKHGNNLVQPASLQAVLTSYNSTIATAAASVRKEVAALNDAISHIESYLHRPPLAPAPVYAQLDHLWWGQSLYSPSLQRSYRDLNEETRLFWMVEDMAQIGCAWPSEAKTAYLTETLRRLDPTVDVKAPVRDHADRLIHGVQDGLELVDDAPITEIPAALASTVTNEATGLPITFIVEAARKRADRAEMMSGLQDKVGLLLDQEISRRQWARWVYRERVLVRFLPEAWAG